MNSEVEPSDHMISLEDCVMHFVNKEDKGMSLVNKDAVKDPTEAAELKLETKSSDETSEYEKLQISPTTYSLIKFLSVLFWLVSFLLFGTLVFAGIEGGNERVNHYVLLIKQSEFNRTNQQNRTEADFQKFYNRSLQLANLRCSLAKLDLYGWNSKNFADSITYSISIFTTLGWGIHCPKSLFGRAVTLIYALFGIPLVAALIGVFMSFLDAVGQRRARSFKLTKKYFGDFDIVSMMIVYFCLAFGIFDGYLVTLTVKWFASGLEENLEKIGLSSDWSLTEGIYFVFINFLTVVGFGDQYTFSKGARSDLVLIHLGNFLPLLFYFAAMKRFFSMIMNYIDYSVDKKLNMVYQAVEDESNEVENIENVSASALGDASDIEID